MTKLETLLANIVTSHDAVTGARLCLHRRQFVDDQDAVDLCESIFQDAASALAAYASRRDDAIKRAIETLTDSMDLYNTRNAIVILQEAIK